MWYTRDWCNRGRYCDKAYRNGIKKDLFKFKSITTEATISEVDCISKLRSKRESKCICTCTNTSSFWAEHKLYDKGIRIIHKKWKTNWCHCFNFIHIPTGLYMFRAHRPILRRIHTAVHTTIGSVSVPFWSCTQHATRTVRILNQWLCEQLCEFSWGWACGPQTCRDPSIYE